MQVRSVDESTGQPVMRADIERPMSVEDTWPAHCRAAAASRGTDEPVMAAEWLAEWVAEWVAEWAAGRD